MLRVKLKPSLPEKFDTTFFHSGTSYVTELSLSKHCVGKREAVFGKAGLNMALLHAYSKKARGWSCHSEKYYRKRVTLQVVLL